MNRLFLWIFCIGVALFAGFLTALVLASPAYDYNVPDVVLVWTLVLGIIGMVAGAPAFAKPPRTRRGFPVVRPDERRPG
jgi:hypothetical protein